MDRWLLDTNAVVSLFTDRNEAQRNTVILAFDKAISGEMQLILHQHVISETVFTLLNVYQIRNTEVSGIVRDLVHHPNVVLENDISWIKVLDLWPSVLRDFGDAIIVAIASDSGYPIFTFDKVLQKTLVKLSIPWVMPSQ
jgi:predicted nucleic-acid-binding protein